MQIFPALASRIAFAAAATSAAISGAKLVPGYAFIVVTNGANLTKIFVSGNSGGSISLLYTTYGVTASGGIPVISQVLPKTPTETLGHSSRSY